MPSSPASFEAAPSFPAGPRAQIVVRGASVARGGTPVLRDVDLVVSPGSRVCVVGENGRGKSTLLALLAARLPPDMGTVDRIGTIAVAEQQN